MKEHKTKEFFASSWAIDNKTVVYVITILITITGIIAYNNLPKEKFPDIVVPTVYVSTVYPGASPKNIEDLITKPIEDELKSVKDIKKVTSTSIESFSAITVEFTTNVKVEEAKQRVKDAVDKAKPELPTDPQRKDPEVIETDFSSIPILFVNLSGDIDLASLKKHAELLEERIEGLPEIREVNIIGALDREIQINVNKFKMEAAKVSFNDIQRAVGSENVTIPGGTVLMDGVRRSVNVSGEFKDVETLSNVIITTTSGESVYLKDIAEIKDGFEEQESYARLDGKNVVTLSVVKKAGENLIAASDKTEAIIKELQANNSLPRDLKVVVTGDQSQETRVTLHDLINTIIIGFILVTIILMFFMGVTNAFFVALSVPLSCFLAFLVFPTIDFSLNMIVLFSFLLALGIVVDDAIVVIENTHRIFDNGKVPIVKAAKIATGEVFLPVLSGTLTTLAPFVPLAFWDGIIGKFMFYLPITLIITLLASLVVAYIMNPVFAVDFMKPHDDHGHEKKAGKTFYQRNKGVIITGAIFVVIALLSYASGAVGIGNFTLTLYVLFLVNKFLLTRLIRNFQTKVWPSFQNRYFNFVNWALKGGRPGLLLISTLVLLFFSIGLISFRQPGVEFFPKADPNFVYVYTSLPIGTDQAYTDSVMKVFEKKVNEVIYPGGKPNPLVESVITSVTINVNEDPNDRSANPHKGKIEVAFVEFAKRNGKSTADYLDRLRDEFKKMDLPHTMKISVDQESGGPPVGKPIAIEITGDNLDELVTVGDSLKAYLDNKQLAGVEELKSDVQKDKPQLTIVIDRERALREGISTAQIGSEIRTAIAGSEISKYKEDKEDYPIMLRYQLAQRDNLAAVMSHKITFRDMNKGGLLRQIPLSAVADLKYENTFGGIKRKNNKKIITLSSNILNGFNPNEVVGGVIEEVENFKNSFEVPSSVSIRFGGEQEDQKETMNFLIGALLTSVGLIFIILMLQFNSLGKTLLIMSEIVLSLIGIMLGLALTGMKVSIVMTGVGFVALAGIVVRNGILLVEFIDILRERGLPLKEAIAEAGKERMTPVLLTATATTLGLVPLAVGLNIDFALLFETGNPHIFFGGDSVAFWGPLAWAMIFGLVFATFLTLVLVPAMYLLYARARNWFRIAIMRRSPDRDFDGFTLKDPKEFHLDAVESPIGTNGHHGNGHPQEEETTIDTKKNK